jgi:hypothetical protein
LPGVRLAVWISAVLGALVLGLATPAIAQKRGGQPKPDPFAIPEHVLRWINAYRAQPRPAEVPDAVRAMSRHGLLRDQETNGVYVGFLAGIIGTNQTDADGLIGKMFPLPPEDQVSLIKAIAYSGLPDWKDLLGRFVERMPARTVLIRRYLDGKSKTLDEQKLDEGPQVLDTLWGYYFATGLFQPVQRIVDGLAWAKDPNDVERLTIASMAKWTLANNASRDVDLLRFLKSEARTRPKPVVAALNEVIEAAETFELGKLRKESVAAIDELKRKGPLRNRQYASWANAGTTLIALGCVAAGALGQVQLGLPCIIGGPLSQAAANYLTPKPQGQ